VADHVDLVFGDVQFLNQLALGDLAVGDDTVRGTVHPAHEQRCRHAFLEGLDIVRRDHHAQTDRASQQHVEELERTHMKEVKVGHVVAAPACPGQGLQAAPQEAQPAHPGLAGAVDAAKGPHHREALVPGDGGFVAGVQRCLRTGLHQALAE
jgi:hypothetical protein